MIDGSETHGKIFAMSMKLPPHFSLAVGDEITLRLPKVDEAEKLFSLVDRNRKHLREFLGWVDMTQTTADSRSFIEENLLHWRQLDSLHLSIWQEGELIGAVGFHEIDFLNRSTSVGFWLDEAHQGRGIMTKSVKALLDYGFHVLDLHRIQILCAVHNLRSQKIAEQLGFQREGTLKEAIHHYGEYFDAYLYGLIAPQ